MRGPLRAAADRRRRRGGGVQPRGGNLLRLEEGSLAAVASSRHVGGDSAPLVAHLRRHPTDALLLSVAVPTIAFAGVTTVPQDAWEIVERCAPAYGDDWWFTGLLAFVRQEQGRFDEAMDLARVSLGDLDAVRVRYETQLRPEPGLGCRTLVDSGSLLWRWTLTPGSRAVPGMDEVLAVVDQSLLARPQSPFMAMHAPSRSVPPRTPPGLASLARSCASRSDPTHVEVTAPLALALRRLVLGDPSGAAATSGSRRRLS